MAKRFASNESAARTAVAATAFALSILCTPAFGQENEADRGSRVEEITVTAQRREQSLQDVPSAIEVYTGSEVRRQGFRDLDDLANFSPTVLIEPRVQDQDISIRGFGTTGNALTLEQAAPTFVDGIHYGRSSQVKLAFLDVQSVEVLKGPQPVYFGQNATAGAFNIRSRRPTDTWEGYLNAEFASDNTDEFSFGIGGPLTDKWGIRVAGVHETSAGYLDYVVTGQPYGAYENTGGRVMLAFEPSDSLTVTGKVEASRIRKDSETISLCRTAGSLIFGRGGPLDNPNRAPGDERSVWDSPTNGGSFWGTPYEALDTDCYSSDKSVSEGGPYYQPPQTIREENSNVGSVDIRDVADGYARTRGTNGAAGYEDLDSTTAYLDVNYRLDNDIDIDWLSGVGNYQRDYVQDNSDSPFLMNFQGRGEDFDQFSTELRVTSPSGGFLEWYVGAFYQTTDLGAFSNSLRANVRQSLRLNDITEEVDSAAVFGVSTFNFMDSRLSLDLGGRYQDVDKNSAVEGFASSWVFTACPEASCDPGLTPVSVTFDPALAGYAGCEGRNGRGDTYCLVDPSTAVLFVPVAPGAPLYAMPYLETRNVPVQWLPGNAIPVGVTATDYAVRADQGEGPWRENFTESGFSPQVTLRYRLNENLMFYGRYAEATKIGGFDTGQISIPTSLDELAFDTEDAQQIEFGVKGAAFDDRLRFDADVFELEFPNLQTTAISPDPNQTSASVNAGQRVRGIEFNGRYAVSDTLRIGLAAAFMDGEMTDFKNSGCTDAEIFQAVGNPNAPCKFFEGGVQFFPTDIIAAVDAEAAFIDRTGSKAPRTPDWKLVLSADYYTPISGKYEFVFNAKGYISDGYILAVESFDQVTKYNQHEDLNLLFSVRNVQDHWAVSVFARNLLEARPSYNAEFDRIPDGLEAVHLSPSSFTSYGVKFEYLIE